MKSSTDLATVAQPSCEGVLLAKNCGDVKSDELAVAGEESKAAGAAPTTVGADATLITASSEMQPVGESLAAI